MRISRGGGPKGDKIGETSRRAGMTRSWIHFTRGRFVRQARVGLGELREEHLSRHGFQGPVAMIYRTEGPNEVVRVEGEYRRREIGLITGHSMMTPLTLESTPAGPGIAA